MSRISVFVAEDEPLAREALALMLTKLPQFEVVGVAANGRHALEACLASPPDVLLTDIRMPLLDGLELAAALRAASPTLQIVFISAYDAHAVKAFEVAAVDYLLKPVGEAQFQRCLERVTVAVKRVRALERLDHDPLTALLRAPPEPPRHLVIRSIGKVELVPLSEISAFRAEGNYVNVVTATRTYLHRETVKSLAERLDPRHFVQVHRSVIVARACVRCVERGEARVVMVDGASYSVGETFVARLKTLGA